MKDIKVSKYRFPLNLQFFAEEGEAVEGTGVEGAPDAGVQPTETSENTGVETPVDAAQVKDEKDFAKAIKAKEEHLRKQMESEYAEKYKDYDVSKKALEYMMRTNGIDDPLTVKEKIELAELEEKAENENLTVEELQRRQELEELKAWKKSVEEKEQQDQQYKQFRSQLDEYAKGKEADAGVLEKFMDDNFADQGKTFDVAYKAMQYDALAKENGELKQQLEKAEKEGVKKFMSAKSSIPTVPGSTSQGHVEAPAPKTFAEARARAMQRLS
jgi:hypothetical protein